MRFAVLLATVALAAAVPAAALGQSGAFGGLPQAQTTPTVVTVDPPLASTSNGGLKTWQQILIFGAAVVLIGGIAYAIVHDAHHRAPVSDAELAHPGMGASRPNRSAKAKARARQKAKQGRRQRRRSRGR